MSETKNHAPHKHEALLYEKLDGKKVQCKLCARYCKIAQGKYGFCLVRKNQEGTLYTLSYGKSTGLEIDLIEKKPFYHFRPGTSCLSFGTPGCNFRCLNCQNWHLSQSPQNSQTPEKALSIQETWPKEIAQACVNHGLDGIAYTYSEPTIFFEYARDTILETKKIAPEKYHVFVSNGYFTRETFELIKKEKLLDAIRIDLKFVENEKYLQTTAASLKPVQESIRRVYSTKKFKRPIHLELIALLIPTLNDDEESVRKLCKFVASVGKDIPLHFIRFFPYHKMQNLPQTPLESLERAKKIASHEGLHYAFIGNADVKGGQDTLCPSCGKLLIARRGMQVTQNVFEGKKDKQPVCPKCGEKINIVL